LNPFTDVDDIDKQIILNGSANSLAQVMANHLGVTVNAFMARSEYKDIYGGSLYRNLVGESAFKAMDNIEGKKGALYLLGAPFGVKGATETGAVNPAMFKFSKGNKPVVTE
jgi:hypothetical protein